MALDKMLTAQDVAKYLDCSYATATKIMEKAGCINLGEGKRTVRRITESALSRYLCSRTMVQEAPAPAPRTKPKRKSTFNTIEMIPIPGNPNGCIVHVPRERQKA